MVFSPYDIPRHSTMSREENLSLAGCVAFYLEVYGRPTFLQRNLRKVLASHQHKLSPSKKGHRKAEMQPDGKMSIEPESPATRFWNPKEIINILERQAFSDHDPVLQIDITDIRDRVAKYRNISQVSEAAETSIRSKPIPALCSLTIWDSSLATKVEQTRTCNIYSHKKADKQRHASIELLNPFMVPLRLLHSESRSSTAGEITYSTQFVIMSVTNTEVWPPVEMQLPVPKNPQLRDDGVAFVKAPLLVAKWTRLPYLPEKEEDSLMEIKALQDNKTYKPKLSLKLNAKWIDADSPLEIFNKERRAKSEPKLETQTLPANILIQTEWIFQGVVGYMNSIMLSGYACILCHNRRFREPAEYHFHLQNSHDRMIFDYSINVATNESGQSVSSGIVRAEVDKKYECYFKQPPELISWQRPKHPFDIEAYLKGNHGWVQGVLKPAQTLNTVKSDIHRSISTDQNRGEVKKSRKRAIEDIPDIIITRKRRFRVPPAPYGISFYRTVSKVPLVEGDELSESDDDINEEWLLEKHTDTIDSFTDTLPKEKLFIQRFDRHMLLEDTCSDLHSEEALIRFCKHNTPWLRRHDMKFEFAKKVAALSLNRLVSNDALVACWRIINDMSIPAEPQDTWAEPNTPNGTKVHRYDRPLENEHSYGRCGICTKVIHDLRNFVRCSDVQCVRKIFHLNCGFCHTTIPTRPKTWYCASCTKAPRQTPLVSRPSKATTTPTTQDKANIESPPQNTTTTITKLTNGTATSNTSTSEKQRLGSRTSAFLTPNSTTPASISTSTSIEAKPPLSIKTNIHAPPQSAPATPQLPTATKLNPPPSAGKMTWRPTTYKNVILLISSEDSGDHGQDEGEDDGDDDGSSQAKEDSDYVNGESGSGEGEGEEEEEEEEEQHG